MSAGRDLYFGFLAETVIRKAQLSELACEPACNHKYGGSLQQRIAEIGELVVAGCKPPV
jgi:hypothetical protein